MSQAGITNIAGGGGGGSPILTLTGNTGGAVPPTANNVNIVGTGSVSVAGNPGTSTLTISVAGDGQTWQTISASQALVSRNGYICISPGGALLLSLPATSVLGDIIDVTLDGATSFAITQGAGQQIRIGSQQTTAGAGGSLTTTQQGDTLRLVCQTANLKWNVLSSVGNFTVV